MTLYFRSKSTPCPATCRASSRRAAGSSSSTPTRTPIRPRRRWPRRSTRRCQRGLQKYPDPMAGAFRRRAAEVLGVPPDWILAGNGSDDILTIVTRALVGEGQLLRLPYPSYILYKTLAELQGARSEEVRFQPDWSLPRRVRRRRPTICGWCSWPIRTAPRARSFRRSACWNWPSGCPARCWSTRRTPISPRRTAWSWWRRTRRSWSRGSLSKSYALAGLRFGYLVAQPQLIEQFVKVKDSYNCDALSIAAAAAAMGDQAWLAANRREDPAARGAGC